MLYKVLAVFQDCIRSILHAENIAGNIEEGALVPDKLPLRMDYESVVKTRRRNVEPCPPTTLRNSHVLFDLTKSMKQKNGSLRNTPEGSPISNYARLTFQDGNDIELN